MILLFIFAFYLIFTQLQQNGVSLKDSFIQTLLMLALVFFLITEMLSVFDLLIHSVVIVVWILFDVLLFIYARKSIKTDSISFWNRIYLSIKSNKFFFLFCLTFFIPLAFLCYYIPPNNNDSMNYHMARIPMWLFNKNVDFYPTLNGLQLYYNPLAEYIILQLELLTNTIRYANFIQLFALVGSCVVVSLILKDRNESKLKQQIAFVLTLTLPVALFQATSTQNDLLNGFFTITAFYYLQKIDKHKGGINTVLLFAIAIALSGLTKFTGWIFLAPFLVYFALKNLIKYQFVFFKKLILIAVVCFVLMLPFFARNMQTFHSPLGAKTKTELSSGLTLTHFSIQQTTSNTLKNIGVLSVVPVQKINQANEFLLNKIHTTLGWQLNTDLDIKFANPYNIRFVFYEDSINNFIHIFLFFAAIIYLLFHRNKEQIRTAFFLIIGVILFSSLIRFQVWNGRLFLPWFFLTIPFLVELFNKQLNLKASRIAIGTLLIIVGYLCVFLNPSKSIIPIKLNQRNKIPTLLSVADIDLLKMKNSTLLSTTFSHQYIERDVFGQKIYQLDQCYKAPDSYIDSLQKQLNFPLQKSIYAKKYAERFYCMDFTLHRLLNNMNQHIKTKNTTVGLAIMRGSFEYLIQYSLLKNPNVQRICNVNYPKVLSNLSNTKKAVSYDYLVTNNFQIYPMLDTASIEFMYDYSMFRLYKFKSTQHKKYLVKDMFNEITSKF